MDGVDFKDTSPELTKVTRIEEVRNVRSAEQRVVLDKSNSLDECFGPSNLPPSGLERMIRRSPHVSSFRNYTSPSLSARRHSDGSFPFLPKPNSRVMEKLTPHRIQRWSYSFLDLLGDHVGIQMFLAFLEKEFSAENLRFWLACQELKQTPRMNVPSLVNKIFGDFLDQDSTHAINVDAKTYNHVKLNLSNPSYNTFDEAQEHIFQLMKTDSYPRFIRSDKYNQILKDTTGKSRKK
ncbi:regulator of G-protein signaling 8-like [Dendronephthya gigantea]|uniref:regulator of G-protein signaling 8-like n=1 Tax=Dendronephthya gigantea TaxID=151771 RepID=UPI001068D35C|nr:regulator of G-protein signaling 8-like [Dendronephthya gigantea]